MLFRSIQCKEDDVIGKDYRYQGTEYEELSNFSYYNSTGNKYANYYGFFNTGRFYNWPNGYNVIFSGNYLNYLGEKGSSDNPETSYKMRLDIVADAAKKVIAANEDPNLNISLMRFSSNNDGAYVGVPLTSVTEIKDTFNTEIDSYDPAGSTPITESIWEAYLYLSEQNVKSGLSATTHNVDGQLFRSNFNEGTDPKMQTFASDYGNVNPYGSYPTNDSSSSTHYTKNNNIKSHPASTENNLGIQYQLPDVGECGDPNQKIILFSDGAAESDTGVNTLIQGKLDIFDTLPNGLNSSCSGDGGCADELAYFLASEERRIAEGAPLLTIDTMGGFLNGGDTSETLLKAIKNHGKGTYYPVANEEDVILALAAATTFPVESPSTFTAPAIAVSSYNSLQLSDNLFYAVFAPNNSGAWAGNLKHYKISSKGIVDKKEEVAVADNGFFNDQSVSFWSTTDTVDGSDVRKGGAAEQFGNVSARNIKIIDTSGSLVQATPERILGLSNNLLGLNDTGLADAILNSAGGITYKQGIANWISGLTPDGTSNRLEMEDAIHSRPIVINYSNNKSIVFIGTNGGYLHAFDTSNGREVFSLMPHEVLPNALGYVDPSRTSVQNKIYGLDGAITYWHNDINLNGVVDGNDTVYLYVGMRRGGHSYYAFNITNPDSPSLLWQKDGNYLNNNKNIPTTVSDGYSRLGQTWSSLKPALVNWNNSNKVVLFAGGGYDPAEDGSANARFDHTTGNTVYMIDAIDGTVLWDAYNDVSGASNEMKSSFAGDVTPVDRNNDGYVDLLYAADTGGRLWRFDFRENSNTFTGGVIADINNSETSGVSENRRFYVSPDVAFIKTTSPSEVTLDDGTTQIVNMKDSFILISIGSGYRAHPLSEDVNDHFYLIKDMYGRDFPTSYTTINVSDLAEWSSSDATDQVKSIHGWYFDPPTVGGKIMSPSITLNGVVTFSTFAKGDDNEENSCTGNLGNSLLYQLAPSEEIRNRITCSDGTDSCKPDIPGDTVTSKSSTSRLTATGTLMTTPPKKCPEGDTCEPPTCDDYVISTLSGTTLTEGNMNRCDLFETNYWEEEL